MIYSGSFKTNLLLYGEPGYARRAERILCYDPAVDTMRGSVRVGFDFGALVPFGSASSYGVTAGTLQAPPFYQRGWLNRTGWNGTSTVGRVGLFSGSEYVTGAGDTFECMFILHSEQPDVAPAMLVGPLSTTKPASAQHMLGVGVSRLGFYFYHNNGEPLFLKYPVQAGVGYELALQFTTTVANFWINGEYQGYGQLTGWPGIGAWSSGGLGVGYSALETLPANDAITVSLSMYRMRITAGRRYTAGNDYTPPDQFYPHRLVTMNAYKDCDVLVIDGDLTPNSLVDLTGRHVPEFFGNASWSPLGGQTGPLTGNNGIKVSDNRSDFMFDGDFTIDVTAKLFCDSASFYATLVTSNRWIADTDTEALGIMWAINSATNPQVLVRTYAGSIVSSAVNYGLTHTPDMWQEFRFVRKSGQCALYVNGVRIGTNTNSKTIKFAFDEDTMGLIIGSRYGNPDTAGILLKRCRFTRAARCDPSKTYYFIDRTFE